MNLKLTLRFVEKLAKKAGDLVKNRQKNVTISSIKDKEDIVTNIDYQAEQIVTESIRRKFPDHNIFSEESGHDSKNSDYTWVIDPLDGSREYLRGLPTYGVLIACQKQGQVILGCTYWPTTDTLFSAAQHLGAFENGTQIKVSSQTKLSHSFIYLNPPNYKHSDQETSHILSVQKTLINRCYRVRPMVFPSLILSWLAKGALEGYLLLHSPGSPGWWDVAAGLIIAQEAGAKITNLHGGSINSQNFSHGLVVTNGKIHHQLLKLLH